MVDRERNKGIPQNSINPDCQPSVISAQNFRQLNNLQTPAQVSPLHIAHRNNSESLTILPDIVQ